MQLVLWETWASLSTEQQHGGGDRARQEMKEDGGKGCGYGSDDDTEEQMEEAEEEGRHILLCVLSFVYCPLCTFSAYQCSP